MSSENFIFSKAKINDVYVIKRNKLLDERGSFSRIYSFKKYKMHGFSPSIDSINYSEVKNKGTIKGLHFQLPPFTETKIVTCLKGKIIDVCIDLRKNSNTFLKFYKIILSEKNRKSLLIPKGFAHGFQTLMDNCEILYLHDAPYNKKHERGINVFDKTLNINWPLEPTKISKRDLSFKFLSKNYKGIDLDEM